MKTKTLMVAIVDESQSMSAQRDDVIEGYNTFLDRQVGLETDEGRIALIKFSGGVTLSDGPVPLRLARPLTRSRYIPHGMTALWDAMLTGIELADREAGPTERILMLTMTDGQNNQSRRIQREPLLEFIRGREATGRWTFTYVGVDPEKFSVEGFAPRGNVAPYVDARSSFRDMTVSTMAYRADTAPRVTTFYRAGLKYEGEKAIQPASTEEYLSSNGLTVYTVTRWRDGTSSCNCPGWAVRKYCRHVNGEADPRGRKVEKR